MRGRCCTSVQGPAPLSWCCTAGVALPVHLPGHGAVAPGGFALSGAAGMPGKPPCPGKPAAKLAATSEHPQTARMKTWGEMSPGRCPLISAWQQGEAGSVGTATRLGAGSCVGALPHRCPPPGERGSVSLDGGMAAWREGGHPRVRARPPLPCCRCPRGAAGLGGQGGVPPAAQPPRVGAPPASGLWDGTLLRAPSLSGGAGDPAAPLPSLGAAGPGHPNSLSQGAAQGHLAPCGTGVPTQAGAQPDRLGAALPSPPAEAGSPVPRHRTYTRGAGKTGAARGVSSARGRRSGSRKCLHGDGRSPGPAGAVMEKYERIRVVGRGAFG